MNSLVRRRLPPSVRNLLTGIRQKENWTDGELDSVTRDGILLPARGVAAEQEELLSPAKTREEQAADEGRDAKRAAICMLCEHQPSRYTCPRCNLPYCGLACYQSPAHVACSEEFYKESVLQELKDMGKTEAEERKKMQDILVRLRQKAGRTDRGIENMLREAGVVQNDDNTEKGGVEERVQVLELLSRLAELQQSGEENEMEIEAILSKLEEFGGEQEGEVEDEEDLADQLSGLDVDELSEEELWGLLNSKEKEKFMGLMRGSALGKLVVLWKPWWEKHEEGGSALVEVLEEVSKPEKDKWTTVTTQEVDKEVKKLQDMVQNHSKSVTKVGKIRKRNGKGTGKDKENSTVPTVPPVSAKIPKISSLCANPSPMICYGLVNALFSYTFTLSMFNGDTDSLIFEVCDTILALSEALDSGRVFSSVQEAIGRGETLISVGGYFDREDPRATARTVEAVAHILMGRDRKDTTGYCLAALSELRSVLSQARAALSKEGEEKAKRQKYFLAGKKCEFFQAWVLDNAQRTRTLAIELWNEHSKRESERSGLEKAKSVVEKGLRKGKNKMIEELS